jgi:hypothetical protein
MLFRYRLQQDHHIPRPENVDPIFEERSGGTGTVETLQLRIRCTDPVFRCDREGSILAGWSFRVRTGQTTWIGGVRAARRRAGTARSTA